MPSRRTYLASVASLSAVSLAGCSGLGGGGQNSGQAGDTDTATTTTTTTKESTKTGDTSETMQVSSSAFDHGGEIPTKYTCDGQDISPPIAAKMSDQANTWALIITDPDAPGGTFTHWLIWNLPPKTDIPEDVPQGDTVSSLGDAPQGTNDFGDVGYGGPCPPEGDGPHTYVFDVYAIADNLDVGAGAKRAELESAIAESDNIVGKGTLKASYER